MLREAQLRGVTFLKRENMCKSKKDKIARSRGYVRKRAVTAVTKGAGISPKGLHFTGALQSL